MRKRLTYVNPWQIGKVAAALYALLSLVFVPFILVAIVVMPKTPNYAGPPPVLLLLLPIFYILMGFVFGVITAAIYNLVAMWTGGIEFIVTDVVTPALPATP